MKIKPNDAVSFRSSNTPHLLKTPLKSDGRVICVEIKAAWDVTPWSLVMPLCSYKNVSNVKTP
jgi:hypothetical protein